MAGGIDWFRWHHGSVTDPKFQLVAKKSKASIAEVIAVWAFLLESASAAHDRGNFGEIDCDAVDCLYGMEDGKTKAILSHMQERGLIADHCVCSWTKRQPKREDDTSAERKRRQRERDHEIELANSVTSNMSRNVTQRHADVTNGHDREEKRREEVLPPKSPKGVEARFETFYAAYPKKVGKDAALRAFAKRKPDDQLVALMVAAIERQKRSDAWLKDGGQFIPNPASWLNQGRWMDEVPTPVAANGDWKSNPMFMGAI